MRYAKFTKPLTVALPSKVYDALKGKSDVEKISMAELVREILSDTVLLSLKSDEKQNHGESVKEENTNG